MWRYSVFSGLIQNALRPTSRIWYRYLRRLEFLYVISALGGITLKSAELEYRPQGSFLCS
ncbi:hypothetical protein NIES2107_37570 [Nostoc carneum NIES-2107]|nr:hypothetical protein NIES2107_37570 [Nostoc carneum NIES-2107]